jgi:hypothetical protein
VFLINQSVISEEIQGDRKGIDEKRKRPVEVDRQLPAGSYYCLSMQKEGMIWQKK